MTTAIDEGRVAKRAAELQGKLEVLRGQLAERSEVNRVVNRKDAAGNLDSKQNSDLPQTSAVLTNEQRNPERPATLQDVIGQTDAVLQLKIATTGAMLQGERAPHILISGESGFGKTSLAEVVAAELSVPMIATNGMLLKKSSDLIGLLLKISGPAVLWCDEIHSAHRAALETFFGLLEDSRVDLLQGSGADTIATTHPLPDLVVVAATTRMGLLPEPFRNRFGLTLTLAEYSDSELAQIVARFWKSKGVKFFRNEDLQVARRSRGVPRNAMNLAKKVRAFAAVSESPNLVTSGMVENAAEVFGIDSNGLDVTDRKILAALTSDFAGRTVGLDALSSHLGIESKTISENHESYLSRRGLLIRTGRGRLATSAAYDLMRS